MENFALCLPLNPTEKQKQILNNRFERLRLIYNDFQNKMLRHYWYVSQTNEWKSFVKVDKKGKLQPDTTKRRKFMNNYITPVRNAKNEVVDMKLFTKYGFTSYILKFNQYEYKGINTSMLIDLSKSAWSAWDKKLYGNSKKNTF